MFLGILISLIGVALIFCVYKKFRNKIYLCCRDTCTPSSDRGKHINIHDKITPENSEFKLTCTRSYEMLVISSLRIQRSRSDGSVIV